jgi:hypothetical protein
VGNQIVIFMPPTCEKYIELEIAYRKMVAYQYPSNEDWKLLIQLKQE